MYKIIIIALLSIICTSCAEKNPDKEPEISTRVEIDSISLKYDIERKKEEESLKLHKSTNPLQGNEWTVYHFENYGNGKGTAWEYYRNWVDSISDVNLKAKHIAKWNVWAVRNGFLSGFTAWDAMIYKRYYGVSSFPNINTDTLNKVLRIENVFQQLKSRYIDSIDFQINDGLVKRGLMTEELHNKYKLFKILQLNGNHRYSEGIKGRRGKHTSIHFWHGNGGWAGSMPNYFPHIFRNKRTVNFTWSVFKPILFNGLNKKEYKNLNCSFYIDRLIEAHEIVKDGKFFDEVFEKPVKLERWETVNYKKIIPKSFKEHFNNSGEFIEKSESTQTDIEEWQEWFFSFWFRRYIEGTTEITYDILIEIRKHYN